MAFEIIGQIIKESQSLQNLSSLNPNQSEQVVTQVQHSLAKSPKLRMKQVMKNHLRLLIPSTKNLDEPCDTSRYVQTANELLSKIFGGDIHKEFTGFYQSDSGQLIREAVVELEAWMTEEQLLDNLAEIEHFLFCLLTELNQETVFIVINNVAALVEVAEINNPNFQAA
jgi:hypothetical protein